MYQDPEFFDNTIDSTSKGLQKNNKKSFNILKKLKKARWLLPLLYLCYIIFLILLIVLSSMGKNIGAEYFAMFLLSLMVIIPGPYVLIEIMNLIQPVFPLLGSGPYLFFLAIILNFFIFYLLGLLIDNFKVIKNLKEIIKGIEKTP